MNWVPESAGPLHVNSNAYGFLCVVIYVNVVDGLLISGQ